ncbi:MAG: XRE family transcriptional regulator [Rhodospirillales bacterium]|nr:XRE family transcriptional regulator [Rhodospirillales bacterium]
MIINMNLIQLSQRIRKFRNRRGYTLEQVAEASGLTRSYLSKVENFRVTPSLATLSKLGEALGVTVAELVEGLDSRPPLVVTRRNEYELVERDRPESRINYYALAQKRPHKLMEPFLLEVPPGTARSRKMSHQGEEFLFVVEGCVVYEHGDRNVILEVGDCLYDEGSVAHTINNPGDELARVLCIYAGITTNVLDNIEEVAVAASAALSTEE